MGCSAQVRVTVCVHVEVGGGWELGHTNSIYVCINESPSPPLPSPPLLFPSSFFLYPPLSSPPLLSPPLPSPPDCDMILHHTEECLSEVHPCHKDKKKAKNYISATLPLKKTASMVEWDGSCESGHYHGYHCLETTLSMVTTLYIGRAKPIFMSLATATNDTYSRCCYDYCCLETVSSYCSHTVCR